MRVPFQPRIAIPIFIALLLVTVANAAAAPKGEAKKGVHSSPERIFTLSVPDVPMTEATDLYGSGSDTGHPEDRSKSSESSKSVSRSVSFPE